MNISNKNVAITMHVLGLIGTYHIKTLIQRDDSPTISYNDILDEDATYDTDNSPPNLLSHIDVLLKFLSKDMKFPHPLDDVFEDITDDKDEQVERKGILFDIDYQLLPFRDSDEGLAESISQFSK